MEDGDRDRDQVNVVTVTHNNQSTVPDLVSGIEEQGSAVAKVIVVDNGSTDETVRLLEEWSASTNLDVTIVRSTNTGFAGGYAVAGTEASFDDTLPTLCLNPDVLLAPGVVDVMLCMLRAANDAAIVTAPLIGLDGTLDSASIRRLPTLGRASVYGVLGTLTPGRWRYNRQERSTTSSASTATIEATTGALMLVASNFRPLSSAIFDTDYFMYGEDLQLCLDARHDGRAVYMSDAAPSVHVKGASSGWPRSVRSNRAFHDAMYLYYRKNLSQGPAIDGAIWFAVQVRLLLSLGVSLPVLVRRRLTLAR